MQAPWRNPRWMLEIDLQTSEFNICFDSVICHIGTLAALEFFRGNLAHEMTDTNSSVLSTMPARLAHDIQFATALGRDSPFDPFQGRDITKLFSERKEASHGLMYYPVKQVRKAPVAIVMAKSTGRTTPAMSEPKIVLNDAFYDSVALPEGPKVSFTKAPRVLLGHLAVAEKPVAKKSRALELAEQSILKKYTGLTEEELMTARQRGALRASRRPPTSEPAGRVVSIGSGPAHQGRSPISLATEVRPKSRASTALSASMQTEKSAAPLKRNTVIFPWDAPKGRHHRKPGGSPSNATVDRPNTATSFLDLSNGTALEEPTQGSPQQQQDRAGGASEADSEEAWLERRKQYLNRFGLLGGSNRYRSQSAPRGPDIANMPGREAPVDFQPRGKEKNDVMYNPKYGVTTRVRSVAHVELGKQASRFQGPNEYLKRINGLLNYDHLSKLHTQTREKEKKAFGGLEAYAMRSASSAGAATEGEGLDDRVFAKPLSAADEFAYNTSSLAPASRNTDAPRTVDSILCADRADEPLSSVLGGDPRPYRRAAKRAVSAMR